MIYKQSKNLRCQKSRETGKKWLEVTTKNKILENTGKKGVLELALRELKKHSSLDTSLFT
jgi:hypothetical protein